MKKHLLLSLPFILMATVFFTVSKNSKKVKKTTLHSRRKKIVMFTSKGGYGHLAATNAMSKLLSPMYDVVVVNPLEELLHKADIVKKLTRGKLDGEKLYNKMLKNGWVRTLNFSTRNIAPMLVRSNNRRNEKIFTNYFNKEKPDLIISAIPIVNQQSINAAEKLNIPYLLVTTDGDLSNWILGLKHIKHPNFTTTIGFEAPTTRELLRKQKVDDFQIVETGFPIRNDFLEKKDVKALKKEWNIPEEKFVIMILMGGAGSSATYKYARKIASMDINAHLLVCVGRDKAMMKRVNKMKKNKNISMTIIPFTKRISDLMATSDLLVTKAGPGSINEGMYMNVPMIIDYTSKTLHWERANANFVSNNKFGVILKRLSKLPGVVNKFIEDKNYYNKVKQALVAYKKPNFNKNIVHLVESICPSKGTGIKVAQKINKQPKVKPQQPSGVTKKA